MKKAAGKPAALKLESSSLVAMVRDAAEFIIGPRFARTRWRLLTMRRFRKRLFRGLLAGRIERAGIVDLGDLMIAEAEHLAQDFIGVFAKQRRALHHGR
jgi:hypothetical protein